MAGKVVLGDVIYFDAASQYEGYNLRAQSTPPVYSTKLYIKHVTVNGGASGGTFQLDDNSSGNLILKCEQAANEEQTYPYYAWVDGLWTTTVDSGVTAQVHCGFD